MGKAYISTFEYDCEIAFNSYDGTSREILRQYIQYIAIEHNYSDNIMPVMYIKVNLMPSIYNKMVPEQGKSKIYLKIYRTKKVGSTSSSAKKVIYDEFDYFMTDDPNNYKVLDTIGEENGTAYKQCLIGLIKMDLKNKNQKTFEGIFKNTNPMSLVQSATSGMKMVIQPFTTNNTFKYFVCPTINSIAQFISYLDQRSSFYNGSYTYYMDFDKTYLISNDGSYIDAKDGDLKYVAFDIRDLTNKESLTSGMIEDESQDSYIIYVSGNDAKIIIDRVTSNLIGTVTSVNPSTGTNTQISRVETSNITNIGTSGGSLVVISRDPKAASNVTTKISETSDTLIVSKIDMDSRVFTPNKQYLLSNYEDNPKYCGVYYLASRKDLYLRVGDIMKCQITLTLRKTADFK